MLLCELQSRAALALHAMLRLCRNAHGATGARALTSELADALRLGICAFGAGLNLSPRTKKDPEMGSFFVGGEGEI